MSRIHMGQLMGVATMANKKTLFVILVGHMSIGVNFLRVKIPKRTMSNETRAMLELLSSLT